MLTKIKIDNALKLHKKYSKMCDDMWSMICLINKFHVTDYIIREYSEVLGVPLKVYALQYKKHVEIGLQYEDVLIFALVANEDAITRFPELKADIEKQIYESRDSTS